jgi:hypothetical protein
MSGVDDRRVQFSGTDTVPTPSFESWVGNRTPEYLSTNAGTSEIAFQNWRTFKEAFAPELVKEAIAETSEALGRPVKVCIDPFGGSGTTALACQFLGVLPITIEVNPFLADLIRAKLEIYDFEILPTMLRRLFSKHKSSRTKQRAFREAPETFVEPGRDGRYIFSRVVANRLAELRARIDQLRDARCQRLLRVMLASSAVALSNVVVSGKGRRYRQNWSERKVTAARVDAEILNCTLRAIYDLKRYSNRKQLKYQVINGDARRSLLRARKVDLAVFSPPYPNSFDYTDVYNVELWIGGYLRSAEDNRSLRMRTLRSHVQIARDFDGKIPGSKTLKATLEKLYGIRPQLWNRYIPEMIRAYFSDIYSILTNLHSKINHGGRVYAVFGDSRYGGVDVPVASIVVEMLGKAGFKLHRSEPFRSMRASPQQGGMAALSETLVVATRV